MVSSLMPNTAPKKLNIVIITMKIRLSAPMALITPLFPSFSVKRSTDPMATSMALLSFMIQNAPPMMSMNTIMSALSTNPSNRAEKTCHVCGFFSV
ncbi:MAG: hypothetical protein BWY89_01648 [Bacteroidetes bacterium ADurb.BinA012]|nr:MAG: hypothetical protein BWY89_01648 [Bacteroidetes bacterium ADurb.BinA012]